MCNVLCSWWCFDSLNSFELEDQLIYFIHMIYMIYMKPSDVHVYNYSPKDTEGVAQKNSNNQEDRLFHAQRRGIAGRNLVIV